VGMAGKGLSEEMDDSGRLHFGIDLHNSGSPPFTGK
jgi:hypothetical protein